MSFNLNGLIASAVATAAVIGAASPASAVVVLERDSAVTFDVLASAGGATSRTRELVSFDEAPGTFSYSNTTTETVLASDPFSGGAGSASGSLTVTDTLTINGDDGFLLQADRAAGGSNQYLLSTVGTSGNYATNLQNSVSVGFQVAEGESVGYSLTGFLEPGTGSTLFIRRSSGPFIYTVNSGTLAATGTLTEGFYTFGFQITDDFVANAANPIASSSSELSATFQVGVVPEPASLALLALGSLCLCPRRTRGGSARGCN